MTDHRVTTEVPLSIGDFSVTNVTPNMYLGVQKHMKTSRLPRFSMDTNISEARAGSFPSLARENQTTP